jgi:SAM-dependent methyltransferase
MSRLSVREIYDRWAPGYQASPHNPLMAAEQETMLARLPELSGRRVLDLACGTGRYGALAVHAGAGDVIALDSSLAMLGRVTVGDRVRADLGALPFQPGSFDVVISGLALGHAVDLRRCLLEIARVLRADGELLYSDFHPEATRLGLRRGFRDAGGTRFELPVDGYSLSQHRELLRGAGFADLEVTEIRAGIELSGDFEGSEQFYRAWRGAPLAFVIHARRSAP